ncbi:MAG: hypothetical protein EOP07_07865 [Proteobacteria bacterium]|nr:MAG: hypothetical protein EOP07_07865 [Pseudomonadota bacterium]
MRLQKNLSLVFVTMLSGFSTSLVAGAPVQQGPRAALLMERDFRSGFTTPENYRSEHCEIYADHVLTRITKADGIEVKARRDTFAVLTEGDIVGLLEEVKELPLEFENGFVDGPKISYFGHIPALAQESSFLLAEDNGDTGEFRFRDSKTARLLRSYIDAVCTQP